MTMSCTWSTQLCHSPSGPQCRGPLPFTCIDRRMCCAWSYQSHSDCESRTPSNNGVTTSSHAAPIVIDLTKHTGSKLSLLKVMEQQ